MSKPLWLSVAVMLAMIALSCAGEKGSVEQHDEAAEPAIKTVEELARERAEAAAKALGSELMKRLRAELKAGGPVEAVRVCSEVAQDLAAAHSVDGVTVRRVSLKVRNPADRPDRFERNALFRLKELHEIGRLPDDVSEVVTIEGERVLRYLLPIRIMPTCLDCHGPAEALDPEVAALIAERYPEDKATGYAVGDLRGVISVTVPLE